MVGVAGGPRWTAGVTGPVCLSYGIEFVTVSARASSARPLLPTWDHFSPNMMIRNRRCQGLLDAGQCRLTATDTLVRMIGYITERQNNIIL